MDSTDYFGMEDMQEVVDEEWYEKSESNSGYLFYKYLNLN